MTKTKSLNPTKNCRAWTVLALAALVALPTSLAPVVAALPGPALIPVPYVFCVTIEQTIAGGVPTLGFFQSRACHLGTDPNQPTLPDGCIFTASQNYGVVTCSPPVAPPPGTYWVCRFPALISVPSSGTVVGTTRCNGGPTAVAVATYPGMTWAGNSPVPVYAFPWTCTADFGREGGERGSTGFVFCDEPDPPAPNPYPTVAGLLA